MKRSLQIAAGLAAVCLVAGAGATLAQQPTTSQLTIEAIEKFLLNAKIGPRKPIGIGVNNTSSAVLDDGKLQHRAHIAIVDIAKASFRGTQGTELNFKDSWKFNVAAYELAKLLQFEMVPPSVERKVVGDPAALTWWIDDAMMEGDRRAKKIQAPDLQSFNNQMYAARVFNQLIYNVDDNLTNLLIAKDWNLWMIDHTRAFRLHRTLESEKNLVKCDRRVLAQMRQLNKPLLTSKLGRWLNSFEIDGLLARRDKIVQFFDKEIAAKGEAEILFDLPVRGF
jgi:hypothetical protein